MTATLASPVGGGPRFGEGRLHIFSPCPAPRIAVRRIRACAARARTAIPPAPQPRHRVRPAAPAQIAVPVRATVSPCPSASPRRRRRLRRQPARAPRRAPGAEIAPAPLPEGTTVTSAPRLHPGIASAPVLRTVGGRPPRSSLATTVPSMSPARNRTARRRLRAASSAAMTMARPRVRPPLPCRTSPPRDERRIPCADPASAPSPMVTSAATSRPTLAMTVVTSALRQPRSRASALRPRLPFGSPSPDRCGRVPSL